MADPNLVAAQDSARAALESAGWSARSFWSALGVGVVTVGVNGCLAWLALDGPKKQRAADREVAQRQRDHEAGRIANVQLAGLKVCQGVYLDADALAATLLNTISMSRGWSRVSEANMDMKRRLISYFLERSIEDAKVIHLLMKTSDAAITIVNALRLPGLELGVQQNIIGVRDVVASVLSECDADRKVIDVEAAARESYLNRLVDNESKTPQF